MSSFQYDSRKEEVEYYFNCVEKLYACYELKSFDNFKKKFNQDNFSSQDFLVMLKANGFLVLYNLVEASIRNMLELIYDEIQIERLNYLQVCNNLQNLWIDLKYAELNSTGTTYNKHKEKAKELITNIIENDLITLSEVKLSGNVDVRTIKEVFEKHGIDISNISREDTPASKMLEVKNKRNNIAHGRVSFLESARDNSIQDLISYKNEIICYLELLFSCITSYIRDKKYTR